MTQMSVTNDTNANGHKQNSSAESDEEQENEQVTAAAAATAVPTDANKQPDLNEPDPINRRMRFLEFSDIYSINHFSSTNG
jgi:hypothetical protein